MIPAKFLTLPQPLSLCRVSFSPTHWSLKNFVWAFFFLSFGGALSAQCPMTSGCAATLRLQSLSEFYTASLGDTVEVSLMLCYTAESEVDTTVDLKLMLPEGMPEIAVTGGDFSESGENSTGITGTTDCIPLTVLISVDSSASPGDIISIPISVEAPPGFCDQSDSVHSTIHLYIVDAENSTCLCENENGNVNLKGNIKLSAAIQKGYFGNPNSPPNIPPCISINGTLTVDVPFFYISNCEILLGPAARIYVNPNASLFLRNNHIHGCDYLWHSISKAGKGTLLAENNLIEDGLYALTFLAANIGVNAPVARISDNLFNKNFIGVSASAPLFGEINFQTFSANTFTCENETLLPSPNPLLSTPPALTKTFTGVQLVQLNNTANLSGNPSSQKNNFEYIQNGIIADGTNIIVKNARFNNIPVNNEYATFVFSNGRGIFANNGLIQEGEGMFSTSPSFKSVRTGIFATVGLPHTGKPASSISIKWNNMEDVKTGIDINGAFISPSLKVLDNSIYCDRIGINLNNIGFFEESLISGNRIYVDDESKGTIVPDKGIGINMNEGSLNGSLESNTIHLYKRNYGLHLSTMYSGLVRENFVFMHTPDAIAGIRLLGSKNVVMICNAVHGVSSDFEVSKNIAVDVNNSPGNWYVCNETDTTGTGFRFSGVCSISSNPLRETEIAGNEMLEHGYGFLMQPDALFGSIINQNAQLHSGNKWWGGYSKDKAIHYGTINQIARSKFLVHTDELPFYPESEDSNNPDAPMPPTPNALATLWFEISNNGSPFSCGELCYPEEFNLSEPDSVNSFGLAIAEDNLSFTPEFDEAIKETLRRHLYRVLDDYPALLNQDSVLQEFFTSEGASVTATLTTIDRLKYAITSIDSTSKSQLLFWETAVQSRLDSISTAASGLPAEPDSIDIANFEDIQIGYLTEIDSFLQLQRQLSCTDWPSKITLIDSALVLNSGIEPTTTIVDNEKKVNQIYLEKALYGNFNLTANEKNRLDSIAGQCPTLGGNAVFRARGILDAAGYWEYYNDDSLCQVSAPRPVTQTNPLAEKPVNMSIYPNPAVDHIIIKPAEQWAGETNISVNDLLGNTVIRRFINESQVNDDPIELSIADLPSGLFIIQIYIGGQNAGSYKLVKLK